MGVVHKLTDEVIQFILKQKQDRPQLSCRELVQEIKVQFQKDVSKSGVHEILKEANIQSPRGRKTKTKFEIPKEKKEQLFQPATLVISKPIEPNLPAPVPAPIIKEETVAINPILEDKPTVPLLATNETIPASDVFMRAAFNDLFPKAWHGISRPEDFLKMEKGAQEDELNYRASAVGGFMLSLTDGCQVVIDNMMQHIDNNIVTEYIEYLPIERALSEMANCFQNNIQPIVIKEVTGNHLNAVFYDFLSAMFVRPGKTIEEIALLDINGTKTVEFKGVMSINRFFVLGISTQITDIKELMSFYDSSVLKAALLIGDKSVEYMAATVCLGEFSLRAIKLMGQDFALLSNMVNLSDGDIIRQYFLRHAPSDKPRKANPYSGQSSQCFIRHLERLIKQSIDDAAWQRLGQLPVTQASNACLSVFNIPPTPSLDGHLIQDLAQAINARNIKDHEGRIIYINILTS